MSKGLEKMSSMLVQASGGDKGSAPTDMGEITKFFKDTVGEVTETWKGKELVKMIKEMVTTDEDQPRQVESSGGGVKEVAELVKALGFDVGSMTGGLQGAASMFQKDAADARKESNEVLKALVGIAMNKSDNSEIKELIKAVTEQRKDPMTDVVKDVSSTLLLETIKRGLGGGGGEKGPMSSLEEAMTFYDMMDKFFERRSKSTQLEPQYRNSLLTPDILRETLQDERERLKIQLEQKNREEDMKARERIAGTFETILREYAPVISGLINTMASRGGGGNLNGVGQQPIPQPTPRVPLTQVATADEEI